MWWRGYWGLAMIGIFLFTSFAFLPLALAEEGVKRFFRTVRPHSIPSR
jgi:hypothetical protein